MVKDLTVVMVQRIDFPSSIPWGRREIAVIDVHIVQLFSFMIVVTSHSTLDFQSALLSIQFRTRIQNLLAF